MLKLVDGELYDRYERLLLQGTLDMMKDVAFCPRPDCGTAVIVNKEDEKEIGICPKCNFAFCLHCNASYHGVAPCKTADSSTFSEEDFDATAREMFAEDVWQKGIQNSMSRKFVNLMKKCPHCGVPVEVRKTLYCVQLYN